MKRLKKKTILTGSSKDKKRIVKITVDIDCEDTKSLLPSLKILNKVYFIMQKHFPNQFDFKDL